MQLQAAQYYGTGAASADIPRDVDVVTSRGSYQWKGRNVK